MDKEKKILGGIILAPILFFVFVLAAAPQINEAKYQRALSYTREGNYAKAQDLYEQIPRYKDTEDLSAYCRAKQKEEAGEDIVSVRSELALVDADYSGELSDEIRPYRRDVERRYDAYWARQNKQSESGKNSKNSPAQPKQASGSTEAPQPATAPTPSGSSPGSG